MNTSGQFSPACYGIHYTNSQDYSGDGYEYRVEAISVPDQDHNVKFKNVINSNPIVYEPDKYGTESYYKININQQKNIWIDISGDSVNGYIWDPKLLRIRGTLTDDYDNYSMMAISDSQMRIIGSNGDFILSDYSGDKYLITGLNTIFFSGLISDTLFVSFAANKL